MTTPEKVKFFEGMIAAYAMLGPIMLIVIAASRPLGTRGELVVFGTGFIVWCLVSALALRLAYGLGVTQGRKVLGT